MNALHCEDAASYVFSFDCGDCGVFNVKGASAQAANGRYFDDIIGQPLPPQLVQEARRRELEYFESKGVWKLVPVEEARAVCGKPPISVRWVDVNKGDDLRPKVRSRLVAREIRRPEEAAIFAACTGTISLVVGLVTNLIGMELPLAPGMS